MMSEPKVSYAASADTLIPSQFIAIISDICQCCSFSMRLLFLVERFVGE